MADKPLKKPEPGPGGDLLKCPVCDSYFEKQDGFHCPKCKRGPLCRKHRVRGKRECLSCVLDRKTRELTLLKDQEQNIRSFLKFMHFLFTTFMIFFVSYKLNLAQTVDFLNNDLIADNLIYLGIAALGGYIFFFVILFSQKKKIEMLSNEILKQRRQFS